MRQSNVDVEDYRAVHACLVSVSESKDWEVVSAAGDGKLEQQRQFHLQVPVRILKPKANRYEQMATDHQVADAQRAMAAAATEALNWNCYCQGMNRSTPGLVIVTVRVPGEEEAATRARADLATAAKALSMYCTQREEPTEAGIRLLLAAFFTTLENLGVDCTDSRAQHLGAAPYLGSVEAADAIEIHQPRPGNE